jgi:DNA-directed RNA polymerase specialized sigma24 family protein
LNEIIDLGREDLQRLVDRLAHHAWCKMRRLTWRGAYFARGGSAPGAYTAEDFVQDAFRKAMDDEGRQWDRAKCPSLERFLRGIIDSDINHKVESIDNAIGRRLFSSTGKHETELSYQLPGTEADPLHAIIDPESREHFYQSASKALKDEPDLQKLLDCLATEVTDRSEMALMLDTTPDEVTNMIKRLRRKLDKLVTRNGPAKKRTRV